MAVAGRTSWPGIYRRELKSGLVVFDATATVNGRQKQSRGHPTPAAALAAKETLRQVIMPGVGAAAPLPPLHGLSRTPTYRAWHNMIQRCTNPKHPFFRDYGGRGITVCDRWRDGFMAFYEAMGVKPKGLTLERIDNDKGYEPGNCCWASWSQQLQNRRSRERVLADRFAPA